MALEVAVLSVSYMSMVLLMLAKHSIAGEVAIYWEEFPCLARSAMLSWMESISEIETGTSHFYDDLANSLDYVWIQFYNNPSCQYTSGDVIKLERARKLWTSNITASDTTKIFLWLPAAPKVALTGFIPVDELTSKVLPWIKGSINYGGAVLWFKYYDDQTGYSTSIKTLV
ncbi:hypothetical protein FNV43_RR18218 [Rhamnella rubrinervis]|uniref:GH18 domain-containing protein n=1 Tax=Rhamnella rubrinervis TaxID=2594499 RepID=A0A8K0DZ10_9ROSA|nr:hypothetical protein FNV43_RR18218 [Rhamnella rubrinervis]